MTAAPAAALSLTVTGPEAAALAGLGNDNLVLRAARRLAEHCGIAPRAALTLDKQLPVASGIGGGSSDAAAALRALSALAWRVPFDDEEAAHTLAATLGAAGPACMLGRPVWVSGVGERLDPAPQLPQLGIVLANPRRKLPTAAVFRGRSGEFAASQRPRLASAEPAALIAALARCRNDLTAPALTLVPQISAVLDRLAALPQARLARMSGSGATCFALFEEPGAARRAAAILRRQEAGWWVEAGTLLADRPPVTPVASTGGS